MNSSFSRRDILRSGGALVVGFAFGGGVTPRLASAQERASFAGKPVDGSGGRHLPRHSP